MDEIKTKHTSGVAIAALVVAIVSLVMAWVPFFNNVFFFSAVISLIMGVSALGSIRKGRATGRGLAIAAIIISIAAGLVVLASQAFYGKVAENVGKAAEEVVNDYDGTNTDKLLKNNVDVTLGQFVFNPGTEAKYNYDDTTELPVTIKNKAAEKSSYTIKIEAVDASGVRVADDTVYVSDLGAGQSASEKAFKYVQPEKVEALKTAQFKVFEVSK